MWRFLMPVTLAIPLLWTVVAEWRFVVDEPAPSGGTNALPAVSTERCGINRGGVDDAHDGYRKWAALALRIDDNPSDDVDILKSPWKELHDLTKKRVESLREARRFTERYRQGEDATPGEPDMYKRALEHRAVDVEFLRERHKRMRVEDAVKLNDYRTKLAKYTGGAGETSIVINHKAREVLTVWIDVNEVLNASPREKRHELLVGALNHVKESAKEQPFTRESEEKIDSIVGQLKKLEGMSSTDLGELQTEVRRVLSYWKDLQYLKKEVNGYQELADKVRGVAEIAEQLRKDQGIHDVTRTRQAAQALCRQYLPAEAAPASSNGVAELYKQGRKYLVESEWSREGLEKLREVPHLEDVARTLLAKPRVFLRS